MIQKTRVILGAALLLTASMAQAVNLSFDGLFTVDNEVQLFNFTTDGASTVYLTSYGYAGGTGADGGVSGPGGGWRPFPWLVLSGRRRLPARPR